MTIKATPLQTHYSWTLLDNGHRWPHLVLGAYWFSWVAQIGGFFWTHFDGPCFEVPVWRPLFGGSFLEALTFRCKPGGSNFKALV